MPTSVLIVHLLSSGDIAGAETVALNLTRSVMRNAQVIIMAPPGRLQDICSDERIEYLPIRVSNIFKIFRLLFWRRPNILHCHDFRASIKGAIFSLLGISIISHIHQNPPWMRSVNLFSISYLAACPFFSRIAVVSQSIAEEGWVFRTFIGKLSVMPNYISLQAVISLASGFELRCSRLAYDVCFLGRLSSEKNPLRALAIAKSFLVSGKPFRCLFIGDGPLRNQCQDFVRHNGLADYVEFMGFLPDPFPELKCCKILLVTSEYEGFSLASLEAMALGIPVVAHCVGGLSTIIDSSCGFLFTHNKAAEGELSRLLSDRNYYATKSQASLRRSLEYDQSRIKLSNLYGDIDFFGSAR